MTARFKVLGALLGVALVAGVVLAITASSAPDRVTHTPCGSVRPGNAPTASLSVAGPRIQDSAGKQFVPYGISIVSGPLTTNWALTEKAAAAQIVAASRYWHANTVRIQASEQQLFVNPTKGRSYNTRFAASLDRLVCLALKQDMIPVLNDATHFTAPKQHAPTRRTIRFWEFMSQRYGNKLPVIFDLYNEPKLTRDPRTRKLMDPNLTWRVWRDGGSIRGSHYVGMQRLVDAIRIKSDVENVIWAEEPYYLYPRERRTDLLPQHLLKGENIVYAFHKSTLEPDSISWRMIREVAERGIPLVDGEWSQFAATDRPWMCLNDAYKAAPEYLAFLREFPIGLLAWSLQPGALVEGRAGQDTVHDGNDTRYTTDPRRLRTPTQMKPSYGCDAASRGQGAGRLVMDYYARYAKRPSQALFPKFG